MHRFSFTLDLLKGGELKLLSTSIFPSLNFCSTLVFIQQGSTGGTLLLGIIIFPSLHISKFTGYVFLWVCLSRGIFISEYNHIPFSQIFKYTLGRALLLSIDKFSFHRFPSTLQEGKTLLLSTNIFPFYIFLSTLVLFYHGLFSTIIFPIYNNVEYRFPFTMD